MTQTLSVEDKAHGLCFPKVFFAYYGSSAPYRERPDEFIDKFEKDNEVKKTRSKLISFNI